MSETNTSENLPVEERVVSLKIQLPNTEEKLDIPCSINDSLFDIIETLKLLPSTREFTSYILKISNQKINDETPIADLIKDGEDSVTISLIPSPYNEITARKHVIETRKIALLETEYDTFEEITGVCAGASTFEELKLSDKQVDEESESTEGDDDESEHKDVSITDEEKEILSNIVNDIVKIDDNIDIIAAKPNIKPSPALKSLFVSQWSPANLSQKLSGDLFYLQAQTLEGEHLSITAHVSGFFLNSSTNNVFNGSISTLKAGRENSNYSLISLLKSISPLFEKQININNEFASTHIADTFIVPNSTTIISPWLVKELPTPTPDLGKSQFNLLHGGIDGADLQVDWNNNYQIIKDIPNENFAQKFGRETNLISTSTDFTAAAIKGAMAIVRGEIDPVNSEEDPAFNIYHRNGIFYSKAIDSISQFQNTGGDEAARASASKDVNSIKLLNKYDIPGVHTLLTTVVDYLGQRILCQAPVPGILSDAPVSEDSEIQQTVKYGFIDDHSDVASNEDYVENFKAVGECFHLKPHKIWNNDGSKVVDVVTSGYTKGTKGTDGRKYIIDLFRSTPLDIEFIEANYDVSKNDSYPHRETVLRHEAIVEWIKRETALAVKNETEKLEKEGKIDTENKPTIGIDDSIFLLNPDAFSLSPAPTPELAAELKKDEDKVREVSKFVGQVLVPEFVKEMENSEVYNAIDGAHLTTLLHQSGINVRYLGEIAKLAAARKIEYLKEQEAKFGEVQKINEEVIKAEEKEQAEKKARIEAIIQKRKEAAEKGEPIPDIKKELEEEERLQKEKEAAEAELTTKLNTISTPNLLDSLYKISITEMVARATKHFLRKETAPIPIPLAPYVISHVHNCLLASTVNANPESPKLNETLSSIYSDVDLSILEKDSKSVIESITKEVYVRFRYTLPENWTESVKIFTLWKSIALKFGIQWKKRDYAFTKEALESQIANSSTKKHDDKHPGKKNKKSASAPVQETETSVTTTFTPEDIVCVVPLVKNSVYEATSISDAWDNGMMKLSSSELEERKEGSIYANQSVQFCERLYGPVHNITASYFTKLGNLYSSSKDNSGALYLLKKAFLIFERCSGIDSFQSSLALNQLANAYIVNDQFVNAVKIYQRLLKYWILAFDEYHPNVLNLFASVGIILLRLKLNKESIQIFEKAIELSDKANTQNSQQSAFFRNQLAQLYLGEKKYEKASEVAEQSFNAYKVTLGLKDKSTIDARRFSLGLKDYIQHLKTEAKRSLEKEQEARRLEQQQNIKAKQVQKSKQTSPNPEIAAKSIEDIVAFIDGSSSGKKKKKNNKKKNSKK